MKIKIIQNSISAFVDKVFLKNTHVYLFTYFQWLFSWYTSKITEWFCQRPHGLQSLKRWLPGPIRRSLPTPALEVWKRSLLYPVIWSPCIFSHSSNSLWITVLCIWKYILSSYYILGIMLGPGSTNINSSRLCFQNSESRQRASITQIVIQMQYNKNDNLFRCSREEAGGAIKTQNRWIEFLFWDLK